LSTFNLLQVIANEFVASLTAEHQDVYD